MIQEYAGLVTTTGDPIASSGLKMDNSQTYISVLTNSESELFIQIHAGFLILGTYLSVQRNQSRSHSVIYLEKKSVSVYDIHDGETSIRHELHAYFTRCITMLKEQGYTILPQNKYLLTLTEVPDITGTLEVPDDVYSYVSGRLLMEKKLCCLSQNPVHTIESISYLLTKLPPELLLGRNITISKNSYDWADISFAENTDRLYHLNLDKLEIQNTGFPKQYKRFGLLYVQMTDDDRKSLMKNHLLQIAKSSSINDENYQIFLQQEHLTTSRISCLASSGISESFEEKEDLESLIKGSGIGKSKHNVTEDNTFTVECNGKKLLEGTDYLYDSVKHVVKILRPSIFQTNDVILDSIFEDKETSCSSKTVVENLRVFQSLIPNEGINMSSGLSDNLSKETRKISIPEIQSGSAIVKESTNPIQHYCAILKQRESQLKKIVWFFDSLPLTRVSRKYAFSFQTEILNHLHRLIEMGVVLGNDWEAAIKTPATLYGIREAAVDVISSMSSANVIRIQELKKTLTHHLEILAYYGERIDAVSDYRLRSSLANFIFSDEITDEQLQQLEREMNTYQKTSPKKDQDVILL